MLLQTYNIYEIMDMLHFGIDVDSNMNKINPFFSEILQQTHKFEEIYVRNYSNVAQTQLLVHMHQQHMVPDCCTKY